MPQASGSQVILKASASVSSGGVKCIAYLVSTHSPPLRSPNGRPHLSKVRKHSIPVPRRALTPKLSPPVVLTPRPPHGYHAVDCGAPAYTAPDPDVLRAVVHVGLFDGGDVVADAGVGEVAAAASLDDSVGDCFLDVSPWGKERGKNLPTWQYSMTRTLAMNGLSGLF